jgi:hypothetical protein
MTIGSTVRSSSAAKRGAVVLAAAAAAALAFPALASAKPFDSPPTALNCASGVGQVASLVNSENENIPPGQVFYSIAELGGPGATVGWLNTDTMQYGTVPLEPTQLFPENPAKVPLGTAATGGGTVISAVFGMYQNAAGETCLLLPGTTTDEVPAPAPAA